MTSITILQQEIRATHRSGIPDPPGRHSGAPVLGVVTASEPNVKNKLSRGRRILPKSWFDKHKRNDGKDIRFSSPKDPNPEIADDLICPILLELPLDPVVAMDGRIYERSAIEEYYRTKKGKSLVRSPVTGEMVHKKLLAAPQIKNHTETLIENGYITGDLADVWTSGVKQERDLLKKAERGDVAAMEKVAIGYEWARHGFKQDQKMAYKWYKKAHAAGCVGAMTKVGELLVLGVGVEKDFRKGMRYLRKAEKQGSDLAACILGLYLADGLNGVSVDKETARAFLEKSLSGNCPYKSMAEKAVQNAQKKLDEIIAGLEASC